MMFVNSDCCRDILAEIQAGFSKNPKKANVKMRHVLSSSVLHEYSEEEILIAYNALLDKHLITLRLLPAVPAGKNTAKIPADTEESVRQSKMKSHHIERITTAGYTFLEASTDKPFWEKINAQKLFDNVCGFIAAGKTTAEIISSVLK